MRGEKFRAACTAPQFAGSPPHARGKEIAVPIPTVEVGITPACAGKRPSPMPPLAAKRDHPRMRGEKYSDCIFRFND